MQKKIYQWLVDFVFVFLFVWVFGLSESSFASIGSRCKNLFLPVHVNWYNHDSLAQLLITNAERLMKKEPQSSKNIFLKHQPGLKTILLHALHNTYQHGNEVAELKYRKKKKLTKRDQLQIGESAVPVFFNAELDQEFLIFHLSNPKIKPFPPELERDFFWNHDLLEEKEDIEESSLISPQSRHGFTGRGVAHAIMLNELSSLPPYSSIKWYTDRDQVHFILKIKVVSTD